MLVESVKFHASCLTAMVLSSVATGRRAPLHHQLLMPERYQGRQRPAVATSVSKTLLASVGTRRRFGVALVALIAVLDRSKDRSRSRRHELTTVTLAEFDRLKGNLAND